MTTKHNVGASSRKTSVFFVGREAPWRERDAEIWGNSLQCWATNPSLGQCVTNKTVSWKLFNKRGKQKKHHSLHELTESSSKIMRYKQAMDDRSRYPDEWESFEHKFAKHVLPLCSPSLPLSASHHLCSNNQTIIIIYLISAIDWSTVYWLIT